MKSMLRAVVVFFLVALSRAIIQKYRPKIVMVTGSVGKTSTKDAVAAALSASFYLRGSEKSYNSEFGVPLTIIGAKNPWNNSAAWLGVISEAFALLLLPNHYPQLLVLEVGADRPGDLKRILKIATPDAVVVTKLPDIPVHVEAYSSPEAVREEEFSPAYALPRGAPLIISSDDEYARTLAERLPVHVLMYGFAPDADTHISHGEMYSKDGAHAGMKATITFGGRSFSIRAPRALGLIQLYAPAAAFTVARAFGESAKHALSGLENYVAPPGRARLLRGREGSTLIDDTYNASPAAVLEVLGSLSLLEAERKIVVLGDMLELGRYSRQQHTEVGRAAAEAADVIVAVGNRAEAIAEAAEEVGTKEVYRYATSKEAAAFLKDFVSAGDVVLIKGSQGIRMERITEALLLDPSDKDELVRQDKEWRQKA